MSIAADLIRRWEQCRLTAYKDGGGVWTIGWGQTGPAIHPGLVWTQQQADAALDHFLASLDAVLDTLITYRYTENQRAAMTSLAYNIGTAAFGSSTLLRKFNAGDVAGAADEFLKWDHDNGKVVTGLTNRRHAERALFLKS